MASIASKAYPPMDPMKAGVAALTSVAPFCSKSKTWVHELCSIAAAQLKTALPGQKTINGQTFRSKSKIQIEDTNLRRKR